MSWRVPIVYFMVWDGLALSSAFTSILCMLSLESTIYVWAAGCQTDRRWTTQGRNTITTRLRSMRSRINLLVKIW